MPEIIIHSCEKTSNIDAMQAILETMRINGKEKTWTQTRQITVDSGRLIEVVEHEHPTRKSPCSCSFDVRNIGA